LFLGESEPDLKESNLILEESEPGLKESNLFLGESEPGLKESNLVLEESKSGLKESNLILEESEPGLKESNLILEESEPGLKESNLILEEAKPALKAPKSKFLAPKSKVFLEFRFYGWAAGGVGEDSPGGVGNLCYVIGRDMGERAFTAGCEAFMMIEKIINRCY